MNSLDLFSGIGGFSLGLEAAGIHTVAFCEREPFCRAVLEERFPNAPIFDDVRTLTIESLRSLPRINLICGGFPCQDISVAGKGVGLSGERSGLWYEMLRVVREVRPDGVLIENVPALRTRGVDDVIEGLEEAGYAAWPFVVGADDVEAPHRRKRVWIVALRLADSAPGGFRTDRTARGESGHLDLGGASLADGHGREGERRSGLLDADGCGVGPVGEPTGEGLEGLGADSGQPEESEPWHPGPRWPARPGEPQHEWEEPRLVAYAERARRSEAGSPGGSFEGGQIRDEGGRTEPERRGDSGGVADAAGESDGRAGLPRQGSDPGSPEREVGPATDGLPLKLARYLNREGLKACGNSVVPWIPYVFGKVLMRALSERRGR